MIIRLVPDLTTDEPTIPQNRHLCREVNEVCNCFYPSMIGLKSENTLAKDQLEKEHCQIGQLTIVRFFILSLDQIFDSADGTSRLDCNDQTNDELA